MFKANDLIRVTRSRYHQAPQAGDTGYVVDSDHATSLVKMETGNLAGKFRVISNHRLEARDTPQASPGRLPGPRIHTQHPEQGHVRIIEKGRMHTTEHATYAAASRWLKDEGLTGTFDCIRVIPLAPITL